MIALYSLIIIIIIIIFFITCNQYVQGGHIFIYSGCSQEKYQPDTPYQTNLNSLLSSIAASSSQTLYNHFATDAPPAYGLYQCRGDLKLRDCSTCITGLISQIDLLCPYTAGASLQLDGCFVRYDAADFLGRLDDSLRYKKCSAGGGGDGEFLRRRDAVLADLQGGAAAGFGVSAAGDVQGYAQCLGDLAAADCGACLGEAAAELKSLCGAAAAGDVFLAQCYVRYWESGYYDHSSSSSDSTNQDDVGRTVAIIVGVIVGVAVLIILLSFCKKTLCK